jgi:hypothetical protein
VTEDEAKMKWCPFARLVAGSISLDGSSTHQSQPAYNRVVDQDKWAFPKGGACIGSACMAWGTLPDQHQYRDLPNGQTPDGEGWEQDGEGFSEGETSWARLITNRGGYCGLAGTPQ